jgi:uncharacterized protein (TIGR02265 family)
MPPTSEPRFHRPRFDKPVPVEDQIRLLPKNAACKGLYFNDPIQRLRQADPGHPLLTEGALGSRRIVPFFDYPYAEFMRLLAEAARVSYPSVPLGEALRRLGRIGYEALLQNQVGKVLFGVFGRDFESIVKMGARGWAVSVNFGEVRVETVGANHVRYHFQAMPGYLETYQVGIVEGGMSVCGVEGEVEVEMRDLANATFDIHWRSPGAKR